METARELVRQSLLSDHDDGMEGDEEDEDDGMEEEEFRPGRRRRLNPFIDVECGVLKRGREEDELSVPTIHFNSLTLTSSHNMTPLS